MARSTVNEKASRPQDDINNGDKQPQTPDPKGNSPSYASKHTSGPSAEGDKQPQSADPKGKTAGGKTGNRSGKRSTDKNTNGDNQPSGDQKMSVSHAKSGEGQVRHDNVTESSTDPKSGKRIFASEGKAVDYKGEKLKDDDDNDMSVDENGYVMDSKGNYAKDKDGNDLYASKDSMTESTGLVDAKQKLTEAAREDINTDLGALLESEDLPDEFQKQAKTIFEGAVGAAVQEHAQSLNEKANQYFTEAVEQYVSELNEHLDDFVDYVVEQWMEENQVAIDSGIRSNIAESFMSNLQGLLEGHYVDVPEDKADIVSDLSERVEEQNQRLNDQLSENSKLNEQLEQAQKQLVVEQYVHGMRTTKADRMRSLAEDVGFDGDKDALNEKLDILFDNYLNESRRQPSRQSGSKALNEDDQSNTRTVVEGVQEAEEETTDPAIAQYAKTLSKMKT